MPEETSAPDSSAPESTTPEKTPRKKAASKVASKKATSKESVQPAETSEPPPAAIKKGSGSTKRATTRKMSGKKTGKKVSSEEAGAKNERDQSQMDLTDQGKSDASAKDSAKDSAKEGQGPQSHQPMRNLNNHLKEHSKISRKGSNNAEAVVVTVVASRDNKSLRKSPKQKSILKK